MEEPSGGASVTVAGVDDGHILTQHRVVPDADPLIAVQRAPVLDEVRANYLETALYLKNAMVTDVDPLPDDEFAAP
jgi:hypothetical protein